ncbi:MAG: hypothetical protein SPL08_01130 [Pseudomonadota bacterium]|nr:hypothetical protein [Pseudomonadota bacterium]
MDTKLSVALLSGLSLFMSLGAFAVSNDAGNDMNWSYAMGGTVQQPDSVDFDELTAMLPPAKPQKEITCTEGCPAREPKKGLTLTYEDEAMPLADRVDIYPAEKPQKDTSTVFDLNDRVFAQQSVSVPPRKNAGQQGEYLTQTVSEDVSIQPVSSEKPIQTEPSNQSARPQVETRYVESESNVQYPITRQYPISVQYPVTVQRNMTVEQPVIMQQPVIVRRPVVVQQDVTVRRQPTVIQQQPMIMQQQPSFIQQQPVVMQAPAVPMTQETWNSINGMLAQPQMVPVNPQPQGLPQQIMQPQISMPQVIDPSYGLSQNGVLYAPYPQQYQVQGQIQAQPIYTMPALYAIPQGQQPMIGAQQPVGPSF